MEEKKMECRAVFPHELKRLRFLDGLVALSRSFGLLFSVTCALSFFSTCSQSTTTANFVFARFSYWPLVQFL